VIVGNANGKSGRAYGMHLFVKEGNFRMLERLKEFNRTSSVRNQVAAYFCPNCGGRISHISRYVRGLLSLKLGTLDDNSWLNSTDMLWLKSAQKWPQFSDGVEKIQEQGGALVLN
jgi:hypothetical protein